MGDASWSGELAKIGYDTLHKFDLYVVTLAFTMLALAVQTAKFSGPPVANVSELLGWAVLFISGTMGLKRIERQSKLFQLEGVRSEVVDRINSLMTKQISHPGALIHYRDSGKDLTYPAAIEAEKAGLANLDQAIKGVEQEAGRAFNVRSRTLVLGIIALMLSRGLGPALAIIEGLR